MKKGCTKEYNVEEQLNYEAEKGEAARELEQELAKEEEGVKKGYMEEFNVPDDNDDQDIACQKEDVGEEPPVKKTKVCLLAPPLQSNLKTNTFFRCPQ